MGPSSFSGFDLEIRDLPLSPLVKAQVPNADLYVVLTLPDLGSFAVCVYTIAILRPQCKTFLPVANRVNLTRSQHRRRLEEPSPVGAILIPVRAPWGSCYELGQTALTMRGEGAEKAQERDSADGEPDQSYPK